MRFNSHNIKFYHLHSHHHYIVLEHSHHPKRNPVPIKQASPILRPLGTRNLLPVSVACPLCTLHGVLQCVAVGARPVSLCPAVLGSPLWHGSVLRSFSWPRGGHRCPGFGNRLRISSRGSLSWKVAQLHSLSGLCDPENYSPRPWSPPNLPQARGQGGPRPPKELPKGGATAWPHSRGPG